MQNLAHNGDRRNQGFRFHSDTKLSGRRPAVSGLELARAIVVKQLDATNAGR